MPQFLLLAKKKNKQPSYLNFLLSRVTFGRELCVLSPSMHRVTQLPSLIVPAGITRTTMADLKEAEEIPSFPWPDGSAVTTNKAVFCLCTLKDIIHFSLQGYYSSHLSLVGLSSEGGWESMSRFTLFLSNFPFLCLKQISLQITVQQLKNQTCSFFLLFSSLKRLISIYLILIARALFCVHVQLHVWNPAISSFSCIKLTWNR